MLFIPPYPYPWPCVAHHLLPQESFANLAVSVSGATAAAEPKDYVRKHAELHGETTDIIMYRARATRTAAAVVAEAAVLAKAAVVIAPAVAIAIAARTVRQQQQQYDREQQQQQ